VARVGLFAILLVGTVTGIVFAVAPSLDLRFAALFYDPATRSFLSAERPFISEFRQFQTYLVAAIGAVAVLSLVVKLVRPNRPMLIPARTVVFLLVTLALGPGLLVNGLLKDHWARPRPGAVVQFGGTEQFMPWWDPRGTCDGNCSFVSGEVSSAFWMLAPAAVVPAPWQGVAIAGAVAFGLAVGLLRAAVGGHFLTDIIFAGVFTALIVWVMHGVIFRWPRTRMSARDPAPPFASPRTAVDARASADQP
jgi:membrane-associated PAP2 superfamily phosphatase